RHFNGDKLKAEVSLIVEEPDMIIRLRLYDAHDKQGLVSLFEKYKGKQVKVPLDLDLYQGKINYSLSYGAIPQLVS
ncbi:MAG: hypothetical protein P1P93_11400, partial [Gammaproteobacteria bacterium]|nr:hypothetical protein [Gammaproteobacteria bacterium]